VPAGVPTSEETIAEFRADYVCSGNPSKSARKVGISERTGREIAQRLQLDASFAEERRVQRARFLEEAVVARHRVLEKALKRFLAKSEVPQVVGEGANVTIIDKRPDYGKLVLEAEKNAHALARFEAEKSGEVLNARDVRITVVGPDDPAKPES